MSDERPTFSQRKLHFFCPLSPCPGHDVVKRMKTDGQLLREYVEHRSEKAFTDLVHRHAAMVHASALRQLGNPHQAEEVAQSVFILLARKADTLSSEVVLGGWLYRATQFAVNDLRKAEFRRQRRETQAYEMNTDPTTATSPAAREPEWQEIAPVLDQCLGRLGQTDRNALLLRFFENRSLAEVGEALGLAEDAARKRVRRSLDKLHALLVQHGSRMEPEALSPLLTRRGAPSLPSTFASGIVAMALHPGTTPSSSTAVTLADQVARNLAWTRWKVWLLSGTAAILTTGGVGWAWHASHAPDPSPTASAPARGTDNYQPAGFNDPDPVHQFIHRLQGAAVGNQWEVFVQSAQFPLRVNSPDGVRILRNEAELRNQIHQVFPVPVLNALLKCPRKGLYCDPRGVMVGSGEIWIAPRKSGPSSGEPAILAINLP
jgi:RNA polymerase sigma factor (sigma-70 family)